MNIRVNISHKKVADGVFLGGGADKEFFKRFAKKGELGPGTGVFHAKVEAVAGDKVVV